MTVSPAPTGTTCWQCGQPAQRVKTNVGACERHCLPNRQERRTMARGGQPAPATPATTGTASTRPRASARDQQHKTANKPKRVVQAAPTTPVYHSVSRAPAGSEHVNASNAIIEQLANPPIWERVALYRARHGTTPAEQWAIDNGGTYTPPTDAFPKRRRRTSRKPR